MHYIRKHSYMTIILYLDILLQEPPNHFSRFGKQEMLNIMCINFKYQYHQALIWKRYKNLEITGRSHCL
jgi:hypothetical protein